MNLLQEKREAAKLRINTLKMPEGGWSFAARAAALERVKRTGLPSRRDEYWKFTNPETLVKQATESAALFKSDEVPFFETDRLKIVFIDGVFCESSSDDLVLNGIEIDRLADVIPNKVHWAQSIYGVIESRGQTPVERPLAALNTAFATDGVLINVKRTPSKPVSLIYDHSSENSDAILHHVIKVNSGASLTVLENGPAAARFNKCMEIQLAEGASFHHIRTQGRDHERRASTHMFAQLNASSTFKSFTLTVNGRLTRNEVVVELSGENSIANIAGACVGDGDFHHDDTVFVTHAAENCDSRQVFKKVLRNGATGVFQGKILVKQCAQKTDGYQISQALLLDNDSQFNAKPELEIYADDVVCSHGSTSGAIDEEALFYLRSRGVERAEAADLLTLAFLGEAVEEIEDESLTEQIVSLLSSWLMRHRPS
ncbi:MAG: Fe-S cluster assembly protein SufD [Aestuariivita sp.]|nr:Fe-S cluster assembly protein SufD [Aestuariivita sp.]